MIPKTNCTLSAFNPATRRWAARPLPSADTQLHAHDPARKKRPLTLVSWNIDAFSPRSIARSQQLLNHMLEVPVPPEIIFLQEVNREVRKSLLSDARVRSGFLATDAEDTMSLGSLPFVTMTFLSKNRFATGAVLEPSDEGKQGRGDMLMVESVSRLSLESVFARDGLSVEIANPSGGVLRLINVHLDSLHNFQSRDVQMRQLASVLHEPECGSGIVAGDFNANTPEDHELIDKYGLSDAWLAVHGTAGPNGATWGLGRKGVQTKRGARFDKVATLGLAVGSMEVLPVGTIEIPRPLEQSSYAPWSDHYGLKCTFAL